MPRNAVAGSFRMSGPGWRGGRCRTVPRGVAGCQNSRALLGRTQIHVGQSIRCLAATPREVATWPDISADLAEAILRLDDPRASPRILGHQRRSGGGWRITPIPRCACAAIGALAGHRARVRGDAALIERLCGDADAMVRVGIAEHPTCGRRAAVQASARTNRIAPPNCNHHARAVTAGEARSPVSGCGLRGHGPACR